MNKEVEILKIGNIMISASGLYDSAQFRNKQTIMVVSDGDELFDYYVGILKECEEYNYMKTTKSIVGKPQTFRSSLVGNQPVDTLKGVSDGDPIIDQSYTINNGSWYTSKIEKIIDDYIIVTKNSVYAIHNLSDLRNKKISNLGL